MYIFEYSFLGSWYPKSWDLIFLGRQFFAALWGGWATLGQSKSRQSPSTHDETEPGAQSLKFRLCSLFLDKDKGCLSY